MSLCLLLCCCFVLCLVCFSRVRSNRRRLENLSPEEQAAAIEAMPAVHGSIVNGPVVAGESSYPMAREAIIAE